MNGQELEIQKIVQGVMAALSNQTGSGSAAPVATATGASTAGKKVGVQDYPLGAKRPDLVRTPTGKRLEELSLDALVEGKISTEDMRIAPETLELQAQVAEDAGRAPFARNLRRAAELIAVPDERVLEIYNALRPNRSTKEELLAIADELQNKYGATVNSAFVREAAEVYAQRGVLKKD